MVLVCGGGGGGGCAARVALPEISRLGQPSARVSLPPQASFFLCRHLCSCSSCILCHPCTLLRPLAGPPTPPLPRTVAHPTTPPLLVASAASTPAHSRGQATPSPTHPPHAVAPVLDPRTKKAVALSVVGREGRSYVARVDPQQPSRLLLQERGSGALYALQVGGRAADRVGRAGGGPLAVCVCGKEMRAPLNHSPRFITRAHTQNYDAFRSPPPHSSHPPSDPCGRGEHRQLAGHGAPVRLPRLGALPAAPALSPTPARTQPWRDGGCAAATLSRPRRQQVAASCLRPWNVLCVRAE
jgi:hypothetical protein